MCTCSSLDSLPSLTRILKVSLSNFTMLWSEKEVPMRHRVHQHPICLPKICSRIKMEYDACIIAYVFILLAWHDFDLHPSLVVLMN